MEKLQKVGFSRGNPPSTHIKDWWCQSAPALKIKYTEDAGCELKILPCQYLIIDISIGASEFCQLSKRNFTYILL